MKRISKFSIILLSLCLFSCSKKDGPIDDPTQNTLSLPNLNLDFELRNDVYPSLPKYWMTGLTKDTESINFSVSLDDQEKHSGNLSLKFEISYNPDSCAVIFSDSLPLKDFVGKTVEVKGWIKTQGVVNGYPGLWFNASDANGNVLNFKSTYSQNLNGDNDWTQVSMTIYGISQNAASIYFGGAFPGLYTQGKGTVWFDDLELYVNGTKVNTN